MTVSPTIKLLFKETLVNVCLCALVAGGGYLYGSHITEQKWEEKVKQAEARADIITKGIRDDYAQFQKNKEQEVRIIAGRLDIALAGLRDRPGRMPDAARPSCAGATGRELAGPDAGFLAREAARTAAVESALEECYKTYDAAKSRIDAFNKGEVK